MSLNNASSRAPFPMLPTLVGFAAAQITGALWYGPLFGKQWMAALNKSKEDFDPSKNGGSTSNGAMMNPILGAAVVWFSSSVCFTTMLQFWSRKEKLSDYMCFAHTAWLGFALPGHVFATIFAEQPKTVSILGATYSLTVFTIMGVVHYLLQ